MKILIINAYAGSPGMGMVFRHYYLAKEWEKRGHEVLIVAGSYSHLRRINPGISKDLEETQEDGTGYLWLRNNEYQGNGMGRAKNMLTFSVKLRKYAGYLKKRFCPDIIFASCTDPLDTFAVQKIAHLTHAKLIHEVRDLWPLTLTELYGVKSSNPLAVAMQIGENSMCRHTDYLVSVLPKAEEHFRAHGLKKGKFRFSPNGIVEEEWENCPEAPESYVKVFRELHAENKFVVCFFGSHTRSYLLEELIRAVQSIDEDRIAVVFVGKGNYKDHLRSCAGEKHGDRFVFLDPVEKQYIPSLLEQADALFVGGIRNSIFRFGIAMNKMFDSMMSGKPILYAVEAPNNYIEEFHCGISVEPENIPALRDGLLRLSELSKEELSAMGMNGRKAVLNHFTYRVIAEDLLKLFSEATGL